MIRITPLIFAFLACAIAGTVSGRELERKGSKGETVYFVLGMLDDYGGRYVIEDIPRVESFYCNENVHAFVFRAYLEQLAREQHLSPQIEDKWRQNCLVSFYSPEISAVINQFYPFSFDSSGSGRTVTELGPKRMANASLPADVVLSQRRDLQLAFLAGAYFRYGNGDKFEFSNSVSKVQLLADLLKAVGCDSVRTTSRAGIPARNGTWFHPTAELSEAFKRWPSQWALERADTIVGLASADELSIYQEVIRCAKQGLFDGCPLPVDFETSRFTFIPMEQSRTGVPGASASENEALANYDEVSHSLRSVHDLSQQGVKVAIPRLGPPHNAALGLGRVSFSRDGRTAVTFAYYNDGVRRTCFREIAAFLSKRSGSWEVSRYATLQER